MFVNLLDVTNSVKNNNLFLPHRGKVVDNNDPLKLNRVKVIIDNLIESDNYDKLPYVYPVIPTSSPSGTVNKPPEINTYLWVEFINGNIYNPVYKGYWYDKHNAIANINNTSHTIFDQDYPNSYGEQDSSGNWYRINKKQNTVDIEHSSGNHINIKRNGETIIDIKNKLTYNVTDIERINASTIELNGNILDSARVTDETTHIDPILGIPVKGAITKGNSKVKQNI